MNTISTDKESISHVDDCKAIVQMDAIVAMFESGLQGLQASIDLYDGIKEKNQLFLHLQHAMKNPIESTFKSAAQARGAFSWFITHKVYRNLLGMNKNMNYILKASDGPDVVFFVGLKEKTQATRNTISDIVLEHVDQGYDKVVKLSIQAVSSNVPKDSFTNVQEMSLGHEQVS